MAMDDLHSLTLCRDDWKIVVHSLYKASSDLLSRAYALGPGSTYGCILHSEGHKVKDVADYINLWLPDND